MGLLGKENKPAERNEISNKALKEHLANTALSTFAQGEHYEELVYTTVEFGYLFDIDGHGLEALFKVTTDKGVFYFAAQGTSLIALDYTESLFQLTTQGFLDLHPAE